ncbi:hypothetical protein DNJ72_09060 [Prochlorococcus marinus XMU1403]|uniref:class I SAM-dependent methyltransferase n=1 Tax=Prochlorococcus marinus TaxID=1219 RepID=UPI000D928C4D|nr:class I SAM-dependent methyltransferase [Prochlorococcus marinus]MBW3050288.1 hypothetical protein [Prochlorococcus marinus str. MU1403]PYE00474.1 hypothetical protein DNJ72_09060 [Prochlorococcus marinus XMU1403]
MTSNFYLDFENKFRGDTESILSQFSKYDFLIDLIIQDVENPKFIDIGSGRGEWIQKWSNKVEDCFGIENDQEMISLCRKKGLNIIDGDAIDILSTLPTNSVSVITIFHMIEHITYKNSITILSECYRVLREDGICIIETPSIDNLIVSTNTFYLDQTHISHINPEALKFYMKSIGFEKVCDFYINGGPMQDDKHSKITRILNGVAQDLLIVATKNESKSQLIFHEDIDWQAKLNQAPRTMQACVDFDLRNEKILLDLNNLNSYSQREIIYLKNALKDQLSAFDVLNNEVNTLKHDLKYILKFYRLIRNILYPFYRIGLKFKKYFSLLPSKILNKIIKNNLIKKIFFSNKIQKCLYFINDKFLFGFASKYLNRNQANLAKYKILDKTSEDFNKLLISHYQRSKRSKTIARSLINNFLDK